VVRLGFFREAVAMLVFAALGGIIMLAGSVCADVPDKNGIGACAGISALAAVVSFRAQEQTVRVRRQAKRSLEAWWFVAVASLAVGAGMFFAVDARV